MKEILRTTIRLYAEKPADREALRLLRQVREKQHLRYADAIVAAVNAHYGQARQVCFNGQQREEIRGIVREEMAASLFRCAEQTTAETLEDANAGRDRPRQSAGHDGQLMRKRTKYLSADARRDLDSIRRHQMRTSGHEHPTGGKLAGVQRRSALVSVQRRSL